MKRLVTVLTVLTFALGLTASGFAQTTVKKEDKPAVQSQTPETKGQQVTPVEKGKEAAKPETKQSDLPKGKKPEKQLSEKDIGKKAAEPVSETEKEVKKAVTK